MDVEAQPASLLVRSQKQWLLDNSIAGYCSKYLMGKVHWKNWRIKRNVVNNDALPLNLEAHRKSLKSKPIQCEHQAPGCTISNGKREVSSTRSVTLPTQCCFLLSTNSIPVLPHASNDCAFLHASSRKTPFHKKESFYITLQGLPSSILRNTYCNEQKKTSKGYVAKIGVML